MWGGDIMTIFLLSRTNVKAGQATRTLGLRLRRGPILDRLLGACGQMREFELLASQIIVNENQYILKRK